MDTFIGRLIDEMGELGDKIDKLEAFLESDKVNEIELIQRSLLQIQFKAMDTYWECLKERIDFLQHPQ